MKGRRATTWTCKFDAISRADTYDCYSGGLNFRVCLASYEQERGMAPGRDPKKRNKEANVCYSFRTCYLDERCSAEKYLARLQEEDASLEDAKLGTELPRSVKKQSGLEQYAVLKARLDGIFYLTSFKFATLLYLARQDASSTIANASGSQWCS